MIFSARERFQQAAQASEAEEKDRLQREREAKLAKEKEEVLSKVHIAYCTMLLWVVRL